MSGNPTKEQCYDIILARADQARRLLAMARDASDAKKIADMAHAAEVYAKRQKASQDCIDYAHSVKIDATLLLGEFLRTSDLQRTRPSKNGLHRKPLLRDKGISKNESFEAQTLAELKKSNPKEIEALRMNKLSVREVMRSVARAKKCAEIKRCQLAPKVRCNDGPYDLILADPPWRYEHCEAGNREIENQYPTATLDDIFGHFDIANPHIVSDQILFLWATAPKLSEAMSVMEKWGFSYRSCAVWDKEVIGMGYWWRIQHELLLVGVKGNPGCTPECERISSVFREKRGKHSAKPQSVYEWLERAFPSCRKLEMYCRHPRDGWSAWGNEV